MFTFGKTHLIFIGIGLSVAVFGSGFLIGQKITKDFYLLEIEKIENSALKTENEYLTKKIEKLFVPKHQYQMYLDAMAV